jgi:hypothetical protein
MHFSDITVQALMYANMYNTVEIKIPGTLTVITRIQAAVFKDSMSGSFFGSVSDL